MLYKKLSENKVQCLACNHFCAILPDKTGICGVRQNKDGKLCLLVYGQAAAVNIDPVEKKPLFHFLPGTQSFSIGTIGCNFKCGFCQNWDISQYGMKTKNSKLKTMYGQEFPPEKIVQEAMTNQCPSISYTYNEPTVFFEYAYDTAKLARQNNLKNIFVSNGFMSEQALAMIAPYLDAINIDLKSFSDRFYREICGGRLSPVLENIKKAFDLNIHVEITTLLIPNKNDSLEEITQIAEFIANVSKSIPWHISRFYPQYQMTDIPPTPEERLVQAYEIGKKTGLRHVYLGNVMTEKYENTYCPKCNEITIKRMIYRIERYDDNGKCQKCGESLDLTI